MNKRLRKKFNQRISRHVRKLAISPNQFVVITTDKPYPVSTLKELQSMIGHPVIMLSTGTKLSAMSKKEAIEYIEQF